MHIHATAIYVYVFTSICDRVAVIPIAIRTKIFSYLMCSAFEGILSWGPNFTNIGVIVVRNNVSVHIKMRKVFLFYSKISSWLGEWCISCAP